MRGEIITKSGEKLPSYIYKSCKLHFRPNFPHIQKCVERPKVSVGTSASCDFVYVRKIMSSVWFSWIALACQQPQLL